MFKRHLKFKMPETQVLVLPYTPTVLTAKTRDSCWIPSLTSYITQLTNPVSLPTKYTKYSQTPTTSPYCHCCHSWPRWHLLLAGLLQLSAKLSLLFQTFAFFWTVIIKTAREILCKKNGGSSHSSFQNLITFTSVSVSHSYPAPCCHSTTCYLCLPALLTHSIPGAFLRFQ